MFYNIYNPALTDLGKNSIACNIKIESTVWFTGMNF